MKSLFDRHGIECIVPPSTSKRTLSLGVKHSPEWVCMPYKVLLGNLAEACELGADTIINVGGPGLCRLGYYAKLHERALRDMGYDFEMVVFNWEEGGIVSLAKVIRQMLGGKLPWRKVVAEIKHGLTQLKLMEDIEKQVHWVRPRELTPGGASRVWRGAGERVRAAYTPAELQTVREEIFGELSAIPLNPNARPLNVGFLGEFFMVSDPFCNMDVEEELGKRGVQVHRSAFLMEWAKVWLFVEALGFSHGKKVKKAASPYLSRDVSGDAVHSLGETILHQLDGFDGVIHLLPFTCMPEIIAQNIFPQVTKDFEIPVLSIVLDEQAGKAGLVTRVEAFVDLMQRRKRRLERSPAATEVMNRAG